MARLRLVLMLLLAGAISLGAGLAIFWLISQMHCAGEQLACNIDDAVGGYATMVWSGLGLIAFGSALLFSAKRMALAIAAIVLLAPLVLSVGGDLLEGWRYVGFYPYADFRSFISKLAPPAFAVLVQYLILRVAVGEGMG